MRSGLIEWPNQPDFLWPIFCMICEPRIVFMCFKKYLFRDFPGGPLAKALCCHCGEGLGVVGVWVPFLVRELRSHMSHDMANTLKKKTKSNKQKCNYCHRPVLLLLYFPSSDIFPSRCFSVTPTDFANLNQELCLPVHHSAGIVIKYTMYFLSSLSCLPLDSDFLHGGITPPNCCE